MFNGKKQRRCLCANRNQQEAGRNNNSVLDYQCQYRHNVGRMKKRHKKFEKSEEELQLIALKACQLLNGLPIWQAIYVGEKLIPAQLKTGHQVNVENPLFIRLINDVKSSADLAEGVRAKS